jgi:4-hydroxy-tetrahydrodipicolinate reductase
MSAATRVVVAGAGGKMGRALIDAVGADKSLALAGSFDIGDDAAKTLAAGDLLIDFTRPEGTLGHLAHCVKLGKAMVIGTTGFSEADKAKIKAAAKTIPIVLSPNFAVGVNAVFKLAETAARILGDDFDVEIIEAHHRQKVDAPSGTALRLGEIISSVLKQELSSSAVHGRHGDTGARPAKQIGFHALRGGDIVGEHTVVFAGIGERVEVTVRSQSRMTYALGALRAAKFLRGRAPGLYGMEDVLGLAN